MDFALVPNFLALGDICPLEGLLQNEMYIWAMTSKREMLNKTKKLTSKCRFY